ncbi:NAD(P)H-binding protein [Dactylosporangium sp. NPDC005555]|uniref:NmrA family NAD(P)-binding protein n=1 Tax=Dactylosporangium sp. NPDC005555 TaxID=3154889 RepID=UPI0033B8BA3F
MDMVLVTGAAGGVGSVGRSVVELLRERDVAVRAFVHREDERAEALRATGAEVVAGDLTDAGDVVRALDGCGRVYFGMSVAASYLKATVTVAAAAREHQRQRHLTALVNMSQMTVSEMTLTSTGESAQHRLQWLGERVLDWSGLPVVQVRPTVFLENPIFASVKDDALRLPFGTARTSPIAARDVAEVVATILAAPGSHIGKVYELTGARSEDMTAMAAEWSAALGRTVTYVDVPLQEWVDEVLAPLHLPEHLRDHLLTMVRLHRDGRYDRLTHDVEQLLGRPATTVRDYVAGPLSTNVKAACGPASPSSSAISPSRPVRR